MGSEWRARTFGAGAGYVRRASTVRAGAGVPQESGEGVSAVKGKKAPARPRSRSVETLA
jgi:hypothetical protein